MSKDAFLYQINFNKKKYPEICEALEEAKQDLGVAWYLRELIQKDIDEKKGVPKLSEHLNFERTVAESFEPVSQAPQNVRSKPKQPTKTVEEELPDDSGGFC